MLVVLEALLDGGNIVRVDRYLQLVPALLYLKYCTSYFRVKVIFDVVVGPTRNIHVNSWLI